LANQYKIDLVRIFEFNDMAAAEETDKDQLIYLQRKRKTGNEEVHTVQAGESLHDIAQKQAIRIESLRELNGLSIKEMPAIGEQLNLKQKSDKKPNLALNSTESKAAALK
jgi:hypothetical protein